MKKNNKGFFLAETLIVISLVTLILAFVYPNLSKLYETFVLKTNFYDQVQDIQAIKSLDFAFNSNIESYCDVVRDYNSSQEDILYKIDNLSVGYEKFEEMGLNNIYVSKYNFKINKLAYYSSSGENVSVDDYGLKRFVKRVRQNKFDPTACRLIGEFSNGDEVRYASVEHVKISGTADEPVLKYDTVLGIEKNVGGVVSDSTTSTQNTKNDEKLFLIIGDSKVGDILESIRNDNSDFYCEIDKDGKNNLSPTYSVDIVKTYPNSCSFYYFNYSDGANYKTHIYSTYDFSFSNQVNSIPSLIKKYINNTSIKRENIYIMFVYGTDYAKNAIDINNLSLVKKQLIDKNQLGGINYLVSTIPTIDSDTYKNCTGESLKGNIAYFTDNLSSEYSGNVLDISDFKPKYNDKKCENKVFDYTDDSNIELFELYLKKLYELSIEKVKGE